MSKIDDILNSNLNEYVNFSDLDQAVSTLKATYTLINPSFKEQPYI